MPTVQRLASFVARPHRHHSWALGTSWELSSVRIIRVLAKGSCSSGWRPTTKFLPPPQLLDPPLPVWKKFICSSKLISQNFVHSPMKCPSTRVIDVWRNHIWPTGVVKEYFKIKVEFFLISWNLILETFILVPGCGGNLGATSQDNTFTSPGYPNGYANNLNCLWVITTLPGNRIWLNLTNLDIEGHFTCSFDKIIIYDSECFLWLSFHCFIVTTKLETCVNCNKSKDDCNKL